jgi:hypothetical protein
MSYWFGEVSHSLDDIFEEDDGTVQTADNYEPFKNDCWRLARFTEVAIPRGATILDARYMTFVASVSDAGKADFRIYGEAVGSSARPSALALDYAISSKSLTAAYTSCVSERFVGDKAGYYHWDVTDVIQELVDRGDWTSGNALSLIMRDSGASDTRFKSYDIGQPDKLEVLYQMSGSSICRWIEHSLDDARQAGVSVNTDGDGVYIGTAAYGYFRFTDVGIPPGAEITACTLQLFCPTSDTDDANLKISVEDSADAPRLAVDEQFVSTRDYGAVNVSWSQSGRVVDQGGWASGNACAFVLYDQSSLVYNVSTYDYDDARQNNHWYAARLHVSYLGGAAARYKKKALWSGLSGGLSQGVA